MKLPGTPGLFFLRHDQLLRSQESLNVPIYSAFYYRKNSMKSKAAQVYGYVVCVIAVVAFLIAVTGVVNSLIDLNAPLYAGFNQDVSLASFEAYKVDAMSSISEDAAYIPTDAELKKMYDAAREDEIGRRSHQTRKNLITNITVIVVSLILFMTHWIWIVRRGRADA